KINSALKSIGVQRNAREIARKDIKVETLGSSAIVQLSVRDQDATVASNLANALSRIVIQTRIDVGKERAVDFADLDKQIAALGSSIAASDAELAALNGQIASSPTSSPDLRSQQDAVAKLRTFQKHTQDQLIAQRDSTSSVVANAPRPTIIQA